MSEDKKISELRTRKRLEQQSIDVAKARLDTAVKPCVPAGAKNAGPNK